jgi:crotonobetainyl-CoA:carnitine CoA-transferase CaiB-like acyl-CoA transferase
VEAQHPSAGTVRLAGFPFMLSQHPAAVRRPPPLLSEHTEEILTELLGYSNSQLTALREQGVV